MDTEIKKPNKKLLDLKVEAGEIDKEFFSMETGDYTLGEKAYEARELWHALGDPESSLGRIAKEEFARVTATNNQDVRHWRLPKKDDEKNIKEDYRCDGLDYGRTEHHSFFTVKSSRIWQVPKKLNPYFLIPMTECSAVIVNERDYLLAAHIYNSRRRQFEALWRLIEGRDISMDRVFVVASTGDIQKKRVMSGSDRLVCKEDYVKHNVPAKNIFTFEYSPENIAEEGGVAGGINAVEVLACKRFILKYEFDVEDINSPVKKKTSDYNNEQVIRLV